MNVQKEFLTVNRFSRPGKKLAKVKGLVLHWVANPGSSAIQNRNYFESLKLQDLNKPNALYASAHFIVGIKGEVAQCIPCEEMAYHAGAKSYTNEAVTVFGNNPNTCTIGIELCHPKADGKFSEATLASAGELCARLCARFSLDPQRDIWTHYAVTRKSCPKWFVENPEELAAFIWDVSACVKRNYKQGA